MVKEGDKAPEFTLPSDDGGTVASKSLSGKPWVIYFYPKDDTPGCTREAIAFSKYRKDFEAAGATVLGVSKDSIASHCKFRDKHKLTILLLSDADLTVHKAYGAWGEKTMYGKKVTGVIRSTFVVGPDGRIAKAFPSVKVDGHAEKVLEAVRAIGSDGGAKPATKASPRGAKPAPKRKAAVKSA